MRRNLPGLNRAVALYFAYSALLHFGLMGIGDTVLNFYFVSLGHNSETIGILQSLPRIGGLLTGLPIGLLANRIGTWRVTVYATIGLVGTFVMLIVWPTLPILGLSRFLLGLSFGAIQIATTPILISLATSQYETFVFSYSNVISMGATAIGSILGGFLPLFAAHWFLDTATVSGVLAEQSPFAYRFSLAIGAAVIFAGILPLYRLENRDSNQQIADSIRANFLVIPFSRLMLLSTPLLLFGFTGGLTFPFYNLFFRSSFDLRDQAVGFILSLGWIGMAFVPLANPIWERNIGRAWALLATMSIAAIAFLGLSFLPTLAISIMLFVIAISFRNVMQPLFQPLIMNTLNPSLHNVASSIGLVIWNIGWFTATAISGFWQSTYGFGFVMKVVALGVFLTGVSIVLIFRKQEPYTQHVEP